MPVPKAGAARQRRQGAKQAHALSPMAETQAGFLDEQAAQGFFRNAGAISPLGQQVLAFRMRVQAATQGLQEGAARQGQHQFYLLGLADRFQ